MKKLLFAFAALAVMTSCQKEMPGLVALDGSDTTDENLTFIANLSQETRTTLDGISVKWSMDDSISVNGVIFEVESIIAETGGTKASFKKRYASVSNPKRPFIATFPVGAFVVENYENPVLKDTIIMKDANSFNMPMIASSSNYQLSFKNCCGVIALSISNDYADNVTSVRFCDGNISRAVVYENAATTTPAGTDFYIPVEPGTYREVSFGVSDNNTIFNNVIYTRNGHSLSIERNTIYPIACSTHPVTYELSKDSVNVTYLGPVDTLSVVSIPDYANRTDVQWYSDNDNVAVVSNDGVITTKNKGIANIIARSPDGRTADTCKVVVNKYATGTYVYNGFYKGSQEYDLYCDTVTRRYLIKDWPDSGNLHFIVTEDNKILTYTTSLETSYGSYGEVFCKDDVSVSATPKLGPSYYDPSAKVFHFNLAFFVRAGILARGEETFTLIPE